VEAVVVDVKEVAYLKLFTRFLALSGLRVLRLPLLIPPSPGILQQPPTYFIHADKH
jgi:hypothetical protein